MSTRKITPKSLFKGRSGGLKDVPYPISRATVVCFFSFIEKISKLNIYFLANQFFKIDRQLKDIKDAKQSHVNAYDDAIEMVNGFEERLKAVHRMARYAQMKVDDLVKTYIEDIKNLKVIVTRQENTLQAMDLRLARAMRMIHMLTDPLLNSKFKKIFFFKTRCKLLVEAAATSNNAGTPEIIDLSSDHPTPSPPPSPGPENIMPPADESQNTRPDVMPDTVFTEGVTPGDFVPGPDALVPEPPVPDHVVPENVLPVETEDVQQKGDQPEGVEPVPGVELVPVSEPVSCKSIIIKFCCFLLINFNKANRDDTSSHTMPPPVQVIPPTPVTSQATGLLRVPDTTPAVESSSGIPSRSRSRSPAPESSQPRRSARLSPAPKPPRSDS